MNESDKPRRVRLQAARLKPETGLNEWAGPFPTLGDSERWRIHEEKLRQEREWRLACIDDIVEDSAKFPSEELGRLRVPSEVVEDTTQRIMYGLVSSWAELVVRFYRELPSEGPDLVTEDEAIAFLNKTFDLELKKVARSLLGKE